MKKITEREALTACAKIWSELAKGGAKDKPKWAEKYQNACPCCEYDEEHGGDYCGKRCIMSGLWKEGCSREGTLWVLWNRATTSKGRKKYAKIIADYANKLLRKLK